MIPRTEAPIHPPLPESRSFAKIRPPSPTTPKSQTKPQGEVAKKGPSCTNPPKRRKTDKNTPVEKRTLSPRKQSPVKEPEIQPAGVEVEYILELQTSERLTNSPAEHSGGQEATRVVQRRDSTPPRRHRTSDLPGNSTHRLVPEPKPTPREPQVDQHLQPTQSGREPGTRARARDEYQPQRSHDRQRSGDQDSSSYQFNRTPNPTHHQSSTHARNSRRPRSRSPKRTGWAGNSQGRHWQNPQPYARGNNRRRSPYRLTNRDQQWSQPRHSNQQQGSWSPQPRDHGPLVDLYVRRSGEIFTVDSDNNATPYRSQSIESNYTPSLPRNDCTLPNYRNNPRDPPGSPPVQVVQPVQPAQPVQQEHFRFAIPRKLLKYYAQLNNLQLGQVQSSDPHLADLDREEVMRRLALTDLQLIRYYEIPITSFVPGGSVSDEMADFINSLSYSAMMLFVPE